MSQARWAPADRRSTSGVDRLANLSFCSSRALRRQGRELAISIHRSVVRGERGPRLDRLPTRPGQVQGALSYASATQVRAAHPADVLALRGAEALVFGAQMGGGLGPCRGWLAAQSLAGIRSIRGYRNRQGRAELSLPAIVISTRRNTVTTVHQCIRKSQVVETKK